MKANRVYSYWDVYDASGKLIVSSYRVTGKSMPSIGDLVTGIPGRPNAIIRDLRLKGIKDNSPCYDVFI